MHAPHLQQRANRGHRLGRLVDCARHASAVRDHAVPQVLQQRASRRRRAKRVDRPRRCAAKQQRAQGLAPRGANADGSKAAEAGAARGRSQLAEVERQRGLRGAGRKARGWSCREAS